MEDKKVTKISLSTFFLILSIIAIIIMGVFIYKINTEKTKANEKSAELQVQVNNLNETINNLQLKMQTISETIKANDVNESNVDTNIISKNTPSDEELIKDLFLAKLKALDSTSTEKLLDYRVDKVEILSNSQKQSAIEMGYSSTDVLAIVTYSVKPKNVNTSNWIAGNGEISGEWIINKTACECLRNEKLLDTSGLNTGW